MRVFQILTIAILNLLLIVTSGAVSDESKDTAGLLEEANDDAAEIAVDKERCNLIRAKAAKSSLSLDELTAFTLCSNLIEVTPLEYDGPVRGLMATNPPHGSGGYLGNQFLEFESQESLS